MAVESDSYIAVGKVLGVFGHQGWLKILVYSGNLDRFDQVKVIFFQSESGMSGKVLSQYRYRKSGLIMKLRGVDTPESAKLLQGKEIFLPDSEQLELPDDQYYIHDLIGLQVYDIEAGIVGEIVDVWSGGASDILVIRAGKKEILIPAVAEFIKEVDLNAGKILVRLWEEL